MSKQDKTIFNPETLMVEMDTSSRHNVLKGLGAVATGVALFGLYMLLYFGVFHLHLPKTAMLLRQKAHWESRVERLGLRMDGFEEELDLLEVRDNRIYRPVYGMRELPSAERDSGNFALPEGLDTTSLLSSAIRRSRTLMQRAWAQCVSYSQVERAAKSAGDMAVHIPAIPPVNPDPRSYRFSSPFGYRTHPILGGVRLHAGIDFGFDSGNPIYCTGDGVVSMIKEENRSYGHQVLVDHGFGYKTRYAHMSQIFVYEGMRLRRGDCVGLSGNTGQSTGPHLHYEVLYQGDPVDPLDFMDLTMSPKDYFEMVHKPSNKR